MSVTRVLSERETDITKKATVRGRQIVHNRICHTE